MRPPCGDMERVEWKGWVVEVDLAATAAAHCERPSGSPEACGCLHCRNFAAARDRAYPGGFVGWLLSLGVPQDKESEIYHLGEEPDGLHLYGGWFHFVGRVITAPREPGMGSDSAFRAWAHSELALVPKPFDAPHVAQLEFETRIPWVLDEPFSP